MNDRILIVEDSNEVRMALQIALEGQGYRVSAAADGREGMRIFRESKPDLVLLDIRLPKLSGIDVCTLIRNESSVPVIMFSGVDERADVLLAIQRGANDYVLKDSGFRELLGRVSKHLRRHTAALVTTQSVKRRGGRVVPFPAAKPAAGRGKQKVATPVAAAALARAAAEVTELSAPTAAAKRPKPPADLTGLKVQTVHIEPEAETPGTEGEPLEDLIIVAHSEAESLDELAKVAARTGYDVMKAATGQEAIAVLTRRRPKLVLLGNVLTDMSCFALVEAVAQHPMGELIGLVLAMGRRSPEMTRRARYLGVHATVFQPWNDGRLDVAIRSALAATRKARSRVAVA
jgi:DNA-binding response OmpR family regulator